MIHVHPRQRVARHTHHNRERNILHLHTGDRSREHTDPLRQTAFRFPFACCCLLSECVAEAEVRVALTTLSLFEPAAPLLSRLLPSTTRRGLKRGLRRLLVPLDAALGSRWTPAGGR